MKVLKEKSLKAFEWAIQAGVNFVLKIASNWRLWKVYCKDPSTGKKGLVRKWSSSKKQVIIRTEQGEKIIIDFGEGMFWEVSYYCEC